MFLINNSFFRCNKHQVCRSEAGQECDSRARTASNRVPWLRARHTTTRSLLTWQRLITGTSDIKSVDLCSWRHQFLLWHVLCGILENVSSLSRVRSQGSPERSRFSTRRLDDDCENFYSRRQSKCPRENENKSRSNRHLRRGASRRIVTTRPLSRPPRYAFIPKTDVEILSPT